MFLSMTGFGSSSAQSGDLSVATEIKTVNNRYLKISLRVSEGYGFLEPVIEAMIRSRISRGTVNVSVRIVRELRVGDSRINESLLRAYFEQVQEIGKSLGVSTAPSLDKFLELPGVVQDDKLLSREFTESA